MSEPVPGEGSLREEALRVEDLVRTYEGGRVRALGGVSFRVGVGEKVALVGPSGSGKSTLLHLLGALEPASAGAVWIAGVRLGPGVDLDRLRARTLGFVFQRDNLLPALTVAENVEVAMRPLGLPRAERRRRARQVLERIDISALAQARPGRLSGGERQRVAVARALVNKPRILLADEPTGNLDSVTGQRLVDLMLERPELTVIAATHDPEVAARMDRVLTLRDGRLVGP